MNTIENNGWLLTDNFGQEIEVNEKRQDFEGNIVTITGGMAPHKEGATGRVYITDEYGVECVHYAGVYGLRWIKS